MRIALDTNILVQANPLASPEGLASELLLPFVAALAAAGPVVPLPMEPPVPILSDPDDDPILQTAVLGEADVLCSRDEVFRDAVVAAYCREHRFRIVGDVDLMRELRAQGEVE